MKIYWGYGYEHNEDDEFVAEVSTFKQMHQIINRIVTREEKCGRIRHFYTRITFCPDYWWADIGSYSMFIKIVDIPENGYEEYKKYNDEEISKKCKDATV